MTSPLLPVAFLPLLGSFASSTTGALVFARTIQGQALCAKHELKETQESQTAIRVVTDNNSVIYYAEPKRIEREFHPRVCQTKVPVTAAGIVWERDGKRYLSLMDIGVAPEQFPATPPSCQDSNESVGGGRMPISNQCTP